MQLGGGLIPSITTHWQPYYACYNNYRLYCEQSLLSNEKGVLQKD